MRNDADVHAYMCERIDVCSARIVYVYVCVYLYTRRHPGDTPDTYVQCSRRDGGQSENGIVRGTAGPTVTAPTLRRAPRRRQDGPRGRREGLRAQASSRSVDRVDSPQRPPLPAGWLYSLALSLPPSHFPSRRRIAKLSPQWRIVLQGTQEPRGRRNFAFALF